MPPAARISDMHTCPMATGVVPHVGGPIITGCATVLIGFMPAARITDKCICTGPPDLIVKGSPTVLIDFMLAARLGDNTAHGGVIVTGMPTVLIGDSGSGPGGGGGGGGGGGDGGGDEGGDEGGGTGGGGVGGGGTGGGGVGTAAASTAAPTGPSEIDEKKGTHYLKIKLVDEDGNSVPGEPYEVKLPDGKVVKKNLDAEGKVHIKGIKESGSCKVSFPKIDKDAWKRLS